MSTEPSVTQRVTGWVGWVWFGAVMMLLAGVLNLVAGIIAITAPDSVYFTPLTGQLWLVDFGTWGWIHLVLGILVVVLGLFLFTGQLWARITSVVLVAINIVFQFIWLPATPWWSIIVIVLDVLVAWALIVHGDEIERAADKAR